MIANAHGAHAGAARAAALSGFLLLLAGCDRKSEFSGPIQPSLDAQLRQTIGNWGVVPIGPTAAQNAAKVELGRALVFDKILSGNRDVSCATCHHATARGDDGLSLSVGTGAVGAGPTRAPGPGRHFVPRNAPSLLNKGLGVAYLNWDGRVSENGFGPPGGPASNGRFSSPAGSALPPGLDNVLAAQAMFPVLNRDEMRGLPGDRDVFGAPNELAPYGDTQFREVWSAVMKRLLAIPEYVRMFEAAYPGVPGSALGFQHAANAIAAFQIEAFTHAGSPFDRYLARDNAALTQAAKRGGLLFFDRGRCSSCHAGPLLGGQSFANVGVPQIGPGTGPGAPLDYGRGDIFGVTEQRFQFRVPPLRNVELTAPYMHNGAFATLEAVVKHYNDVPSSLREYDPTQLAAALRGTLHGDAATIAAIERTLDFRLRQPLRLTDEDQRDLVAFLESLTDPAARDLSAIAPARVPSGLPVRD